MLDEYKSFEEKEVYELVDRTEEMRTIDSKWILKKKKNNDGSTKFKARLVIRGFKHKKKYEKFEKYSPVAKIGVIRMFLAVANKFKVPIHQYDVKTAFLNGVLDEDIYMEIPEGFVKEEKFRENKVLKLKRSLYGLSISPKCWYERLHKAITAVGLKRDPAEPCLYFWKENNDFVLLVVYVDDMLITGTEQSIVEKLKEELYKNFEMTSLGEPRKYIGINIDRNFDSGEMFLHQRDYIKEVVKEYSFGKEKVALTPFLPVSESGEKIDERNDVVEWNNKTFNFREILGKLLFIANCTRPDLAFAVNSLARSQDRPCLGDWRKMKRVVDYLRTTANRGIFLQGNGEDMSCFVDADFASDKVDRKSTSGYLVKLFGDTITWRSKKQGCVSTSSAEAEYVALSTACKEIMTLSGIYERTVRSLRSRPIVYEDNRSAIMSAKSYETGRLRHVDVSYHFFKDLIVKGKILLDWISSEDQEADFLTKRLQRSSFEKCCKTVMKFKVLN